MLTVLSGEPTQIVGQALASLGLSSHVGKHDKAVLNGLLVALSLWNSFYLHLGLSDSLYVTEESIPTLPWCLFC